MQVEVFSQPGSNDPLEPGIVQSKKHTKYGHGIAPSALVQPQVNHTA